MKTILIICLVLGAGTSFCQVNDLIQIRDSIIAYRTQILQGIVDDSLASRYYSKDAYNKYFDKYFTLLNYERETFAEGNSASLKISDNQTRLNLTLSRKIKSSILSVGTGVNVSDNSGTLFSNSKPTSGTQFYVNHSILLSGQTSLHFDDDLRFENYNNRRALIDSLYTVHVIKNPNRAPLLHAQVDSMNNVIQNAISEIATTSDVTIRRHQAILTKTLAEKEKIMTQLKELELSSPVEEIVQGIKARTDEAGVNQELKTEGVTVFNLKWISYGLSYQRDNYQTYDDALPFNDRIHEKPFDGWSISIGYNYFWQRNRAWIEFRNAKGINSVFFNLNYSMKASNSFSELLEKNLNIITTEIRNDTVYQFSIQEKLRNISDTKFKRYLVHKVGMQLTSMLGKKQFIGINLSSNAEVSGERDPVYSARTGLLFRFSDSASQKAKVNFEIFMSFNDLTDTNNSDESIWKRKTIGISASVPFQKIFFK